MTELDEKEKHVNTIKALISKTYSAEILARKYKHTVQSLIDAIPKLNDEYYLRYIADALGEIGDVKAVEPLCKLIQHESPHVRGAAAEALGKIGDVQALESLFVALNDVDPSHLRFSIRKKAAWALGKIGDKRAIQPLMNIARDESFHARFARAAACEALGEIAQIGDQQILALLASALQNKDSDVRLAACKALGNIGDEQVLEQLDKVRVSDEDCLRDQDTKEPVEWPVREAAYQAIEKIRKHVKPKAK
jgi:HEAT repeat protein